MFRYRRLHLLTNGLHAQIVQESIETAISGVLQHQLICFDANRFSFFNLGRFAFSSGNSFAFYERSARHSMIEESLQEEHYMEMAFDNPPESSFHCSDKSVRSHIPSLYDGSQTDSETQTATAKVPSNKTTAAPTTDGAV